MQQRNMLSGKVAIVTGASRGLGQYCAMAFAAEGAKVAVVGRSARETNLHMPGNVYFTADMIEELTGEEALPILCDVSDPQAVESMVYQVLQKWGKVDILLNNASFVLPEGESFVEIPPRIFEQMMQINVLGAFHVVRAVLPTMRARQNGNIINISGRSRYGGTPLEATKVAIEVMTTGLAESLYADGIAVNSLRPAGFIDTPGVLLNRDVKPGDLMMPYSYVDASLLLATQTADTYTGQIRTDAEIIRDLSTEVVLTRYKQMNPPQWRNSLETWSIDGFTRGR